MADERNQGTEVATEPASASDGPSPDPSLALLPIVDESKYRLNGEVARGGVGRIIAARDTHLDRDVAIKQLHDVRGNGARFVREALLTARLQLPSIVAVHEVGRFKSGEPFLAMKLVRGHSLREEVQRRSTLEARLELLPNILAVADAMAYAHSQQVIHRDLKPANVLLGAFGETVVIDWGLAKQVEEAELPTPTAGSPVEAAELTEIGTIIGTPMYMPPEQAMGRPVDERADVYALGALLYHLLAGVPPFEGSDSRAVLEQVLTRRPSTLRSRNVDVPTDLEAIVQKAMAPRLQDRYRDAGGLAADLRRFQLGQIPAARPSTLDEDPEIEHAYEEEVRRKTLRPLRVSCLLALVLLPGFAIFEAMQLHQWSRALLGARALVMACTVGIFSASFTRFGERNSALLSMSLMVFVGDMLVIVNRLENGRLEGAFLGSILLIFLSCAIMFHLRPQVIATTLMLIAITHWFFGPPATFWTRANWFSISGASIVVAAFGASITYQLQRAEFYNRHRLKAANERLAVLDRRS